MPITFSCPCGQQLSVSRKQAGAVVGCPACSSTVTVPLVGLPAARTAPHTQPPLPAGNTVRYWLQTNGGGGLQGPYIQEHLRDWVKGGQIPSSSLVCPEGGAQWLTLAQLLGLRGQQQVASAVSLPPSSQGQAVQYVPVASPVHFFPKAPWNPVAIGWLGVLFSPVWAGIMAGLNAGRLGPQFSVWRPIVIGVASLVLDLAVSAVIDFYLVDLVIYLGAVGLIWVLDLAPQAEAFASQAGHSRPGANWIIPSLAGTPLALVVFLGLVVAPLLPLEPREVCQRFSAASTEPEMKKYTTSRLWPALAVLTRMEDHSAPVDFELTDESPAPEGYAGYLVGCRTSFTENQQRFHVEGVFHLVERQGEWKIDDIYFTAVNGQRFDPWFSVATDYQQLAAVTPNQIHPSQAKQPSGGSSDSAKGKNSWLIHAGRTFMASGLLKKIGVFLAAVVVAIAAILGKAFGTPAKDTTR